jgi:hypothetical protein
MKLETTFSVRGSTAQAVQYGRGGRNHLTIDIYPDIVAADAARAASANVRRSDRKCGLGLARMLARSPQAQTQTGAGATETARVVLP